MRTLMSTRIAKVSSVVLLLNLGLILGLILAAALPALSVSANNPAVASALTGYYNLIGYEGIGTVGSVLTIHGDVPVVGDYVTTHCRYIDVPNATYGQYYLRYPLHLPNGATITGVSLYVADFNSNSGGTMFVHMMSRPWNSSQGGTNFTSSIGTSSGAAGNQTISATGINVVVNNQTTEYWLDVMPVNSADPGQLCVYGIQVTYTVNGAFLPLIQKGG